MNGSLGTGGSGGPLHGGHDFTRLLNAAWGASERSSWTYGRLGDRTQNWEVDAVERPGFVYVSLGIDGNGEVQIARNDGIAKIKQLPIKMRNENGIWVIHGVDASSSSPTDYIYGPGGNEYGVPPHTHRLDSGMSYAVESLRLEPGRLTWDGGMTVHIFEFRYRATAGVWKSWLGGTIDLTSYKPATSGHWAWVVVSIDITTNTATATPGTSQVYALPLTSTELDAVTIPETSIPCGAVKVRNDATDVSDMDLFIEVRGWLNIPQSLATLDDVPDVEASVPGDGDLLRFSTFDNMWHAVPLLVDIDELNDVIITTPLTGDILTYNGTDWVNESPDAFLRSDGTIPLDGPITRWDIGEDNSIAADLIVARDGATGLTFQDDDFHNAFSVRQIYATAALNVFDYLIKGPQDAQGPIHFALTTGYFLVTETQVNTVGGPIPSTVIVGFIVSSPAVVCTITYAVNSDIGGATGGGTFSLLYGATHVVTHGTVSWTFEVVSPGGALTIEQTAGSDAIAQFVCIIAYV